MDIGQKLKSFAEYQLGVNDLLAAFNTGLTERLEEKNFADAIDCYGVCLCISYDRRSYSGSL